MKIYFLVFILSTPQIKILIGTFSLTTDHQSLTTDRCLSFAISADVSHREPGAVLFCGPTANGGTRRPAAFGREFAQVQAIAIRPVSIQPNLAVCRSRNFVVVAGEHRG